MATEKVSFVKPPITETVIGVQFEPLENFQIVDYGLFWEKYLSRDFPQVQEVSPVSLRQEVKQLSPVQQTWQFVQDVPLPRAWYLGTDADDGQELLQVQPSLFMHNWRKRALSDQGYPRYKANIERFRTTLDLFLRFKDERKLGDFRPNQCELNYINHIPILDDCLSPVDMFPRVFDVFRKNSERKAAEPRQPENLWFNSSYWIDEISSRLSVSGSLGQVSATGQLIVDFRLVCRGKPAGQSVDELINWFNVAHTNVVRTFASLTTTEMHTLWEKEHE